jgi:hypothetical protein
MGFMEHFSSFRLPKQEVGTSWHQAQPIGSSVPDQPSDCLSFKIMPMGCEISASYCPKMANIFIDN